MTVTGPEIDSTETEAPTDALVDSGETDGRGEVVEDVLVEEISIDGMCGVY